MSQSLVNEGGGAKTPLSGAIAAAVLLVVALFFTHLLRDLPQPVLAAIVLVAVAGLFQASALRELLQKDRKEFVVAMVALLGVLGSGLLRGVLIGVAISMVQLIRQASRPHVALLGRIPGTQRFSDRDRHLDNELIPGVMIFRPEAGLVYFNVDHVLDRIQERMQAEAQVPRLLVLDLSATPQMDLQSAHALAGLIRKLAASGTRVQLVEARSSVRDRLRSVCSEGTLGPLNRLGSVSDAVAAFLQEPGSPA
jgi:MFS superfamily sulfate permease-like transporter